MHKEHIRYTRTNSPTSANALHILNNRHEYGPAEQTLKLLKPCNKGTKINCWETLYMQAFHQHNILIAEQQVNPYTSLLIQHVTNYGSPNTVSFCTAHCTQTNKGKSNYLRYSRSSLSLNITILMKVLHYRLDKYEAK